MGGVLNVPQGGQPVPGQDAWRLPNGQYSPMTPVQIMMKDLISPFTGGLAAQTGRVVDGYNQRLKKKLDEVDRPSQQGQQQ